MIVVLFDPRRPSLVPVEAIEHLAGEVQYTEEMPVAVPWSLPAARPVDTGDVCLNFDRKYFAKKKLSAPKTLDDLTKPQYKGLLVVENPATSSPGLAFLLATVAKFGPNGWQAYWEKLRNNDVKVVDGWEQAYNTEFSGSAGKGDYPLVVSYASSPPAGVGNAHPAPSQPPTGALLNTCFRQIEFVGIM